MKKHGTRMHSKYSASGAERWFACPGSVQLSEGLPDKETEKGKEGTFAHEVLEAVLRQHPIPPGATKAMIDDAKKAASHIIDLYKKEAPSDLMVEERVLLDFIHPEAFGSLDAAIIGHFGTLHILDYKYGKWAVSPEENLQFIFYALAVAHKYDWNFERVRMWTMQPRVPNFSGYTFWEIGILELKKWVDVFKAAIARVEKFPTKYVEGKHCFFCKAKAICPLKQDARIEKAKSVFSSVRKTKEK